MGDGMHGVGLGATVTNTPTEFKFVSGEGFAVAVLLVSTARDAFGSPAHSPSTTLRKGLVLGRITASGKFCEYDDDGTDDGRRVARGILDEEVNLLNAAGSAEDKLGSMHLRGVYDEDKLQNIDANGKADLRGFGSLFKEDIYG